MSVIDYKNKIDGALRRNAAGQPPKSSRPGSRRVHTKASKKTMRELVSSWLFLSPSLIGVAAFFVIPFCVVVFYSVVNNPIQKIFVGFDNYVRVWNNSAFKLAAGNTLKFSLVSVPLAVALSLFLAVVMESRIPFKSQFRTFFLSPMMVPIASIVLIWQVMFHYNGIVNEIGQALGAVKIDWLKSGDAQIVIVLLFLWKNLGYNMILFMAALSSVPKELIEVSRLESASEWQIFWRIKMRYLSSTILFVAIMSLINSFKVFREIYLMTGDYPYDSLYMLQHFMNNTFQSMDYQKLSSAAVIMSLVIVVLMLVMFVTEDRYGRDIEG